MNLLKGLILSSFIMIGTVGFSQTSWDDWSTDRCYAEKGVSKQYKYVNVSTGYYYVKVKYCRDLTWHREYQEDEVYYWNCNDNDCDWKYQEKQSGYFWRFTASKWYQCY